MSQFCTIDTPMLASLSREARALPRKRKNHNFHASEKAVCHRLLNAIEPDSYIPPHRHLSSDKDETILVLAGRIGVLAFDDKGIVTMRRIMAPASGTVGVNIPAGVFHSMVALEPGSVFFESKAGPYEPLKPEEKAPWAPAEDAFGANDYLAFMADFFRP
ncbi:cupin fold metalloprotein, WbuC family [Formivibrio citricus]|uniref:Cupin fold metalloprotein, WbuC family n=1 Tax=Formivibrio citricus TaxID=83765 RepID=A0A1I4V7J6_9NEIS|nr:WbuC family cupin fold metalloprotein [Formivibrio citricus]SFM97157.1 cupin fold metalloprotein, WbuC family [Formivibrio citricus]